MRPEQLLEMNEYPTSAAFTEIEKAVLRLSDAMTLTPAHVPDDLFDELRRHMSEQQLVELSSAIAWENYRARFNRVFGVESEDFSRGAYCPLPVPHPSSPDVAAGPDSAPEPNDVAR